MDIRSHIRYASYVIRHKWYVFLEARKLGITWLGVIHDLSKLCPSEWIPYTNHFYGNRPQQRDSTGYYKPADTGDVAFENAWLLHIHRNKHHWQWWILHLDDGGAVCMPMPDKYRREMLADWRGAGLAQGKPDTKAWFVTNKARGRIALHPETENWIRQQLGIDV